MSLAALFSRQSGPEYHKVATEGSDDPESGRPLMGSSLSMPRLSRKGIMALFGGIFMLILIGVAGHSHIDPVSVSVSKVLHLTPGFEQRKLRIIAPADEPGTNLCKLLFSTYANGYPAPLIVNWQRDFGKGEPGAGFGSSHLGKISGVYEGLNALTDESAPAGERLADDDIVFVVDAYDVWFQLPPEILLQRYYAALARADERVAKEWYADAPGAAPAPKQDIIISTQKKCWPREKDGHATRCDILPESTLRTDLYGPETDKGNLHDTRPRYINSGSIMGSAGALKKYLAEAKRVVDEAAANDQHMFSDQGVLGSILGSQEAWRKQEREINARAAAGENVTAVVREFDAKVEFGLGLDYVQDLSTPTVFEEDDGAYMVLNDEEQVRNLSATGGVVPPRISGVPEDMNSLPSPLQVAGIRAARDAEEDFDASKDPSWADVPLYTDFWSEVVTVAVHHNAHRDGMKGRRLKEWWSHNWFFPYLREVADLSSQPRPLKSLGKVTNDGNKLEFWAPAADAEKTMPRILRAEAEDVFQEADWNTFCSKPGEEEWWDVVFQDGKGWGA